MKFEKIIADPEPKEACHASTIVEMDNGQLLVAWFSGSGEGRDDVRILGSTRTESGWSRPRLLAKVNETAHWNPVLFNPSDGSIWLFFKVGKTIPGWVTYRMFSRDCGETWAEPRELVPGDSSGGRGPVKNKPILLSNGHWLAPASVETKTRWDAFTDCSRDGGGSWEKSNLIHFSASSQEGKGVIQPTLWESTPGRVHMLLRSTCGWICRSDSDDFGRTWSQASVIDVPNNNSGIDLVKLPDGRLAMLYNPVSNPKDRMPLSLAVSEDNGNHWFSITETSDFPVIPGRDPAPGELSYPSIIRLQKKNTVAGVYTWHRRNICFMQETL